MLNLDHTWLFYKMQINVCNKTAQHILKNEVDLILPKFPEGRKSRRGIFSTIISGFEGLVFERISSFLHNRRNKALHKEVCTMSFKADIQRNIHTLWKYFSYVWSLKHRNIRQTYKNCTYITQQAIHVQEIICRTDNQGL